MMYKIDIPELENYAYSLINRKSIRIERIFIVDETDSKYILEFSYRDEDLYFMVGTIHIFKNKFIRYIRNKKLNKICSKKEMQCSV